MTITTDWNGIALNKLTRVLGERAGRQTMSEALSAIGVDELRSAEDLRRFANELSGRGGFAAALGGLLGVHAAMYGDVTSTK